MMNTAYHNQKLRALAAFFCTIFNHRLLSTLFLSPLPLSTLILSALSLSTPSIAIDAPPLTLVRALQVTYQDKTQPSGLTFCRGKLLTISDKHDSIIFELKLKSKTAQLIPFIELDSIPEPPSNGLSTSVKARQKIDEKVLSRKYDWEGITCDPENNLYLVSENHLAIAKIDNENQLSWLNVDLYSAGQEESLFTLYNGYIEGISWAPNNTLYLTAEREDRGIISIHRNNSLWKIDRTDAIPLSALKIAEQRSLDFSGLSFEKNWLFTLERNLFAICRRNLKDFSEQFCWSYQNSELNDHYKYQETEFGTAEGITQDKGYVYIILDNNEKLLESSGKDTPLLFIFKKPNNWLHPQP